MYMNVRNINFTSLSIRFWNWSEVVVFFVFQLYMIMTFFKYIPLFL